MSVELSDAEMLRYNRQIIPVSYTHLTLQTTERV